MNRNIVKSIMLVVLAVSLLVLAGCAETEGESMGVWGYVASADGAQLELASTQLDTTRIKIDRVLVPENAWIVVHLDDDGMPGERVGLLQIEKGESSDLVVELDGVTTSNVIVAVHADRGEEGEFDFDMENKESSPDRPFFVDGEELAAVVEVAEFGVKAEAGTASILVSDQAVEATLSVDSATAPTDAWVVVHLDDDGMPGELVGVARIPAGESLGIVVELDPSVQLTESLLVAVHADRGVSGEYEFDMEDKLGSPDQPFFVDGAEVATAIAVK